MKISPPASSSASSASIESVDSKFQLASDEGMGEEQNLEGSRASRKDTGLSNCVVQLVQANERLTMQILELQESLSVSHIGRNVFQEESSKLSKESFSLNKEKQADTLQISELQESLALARNERNEFQEENSKLLKANAILKDAKKTEATVQISELQESLALNRKERNDVQEENSKLLRVNVILKDAKTAETTVKILEHQTSLALSFQEVNSKLLREVACLKNAMEAEVRTLFMRILMISSRWYLLFICHLSSLTTTKFFKRSGSTITLGEIRYCGLRYIEHIVSENLSDNDARINIFYKCPQMLLGVHRWDLLIEESCDNLQLGFVDLSALSGDLVFDYSPNGSVYRRDAKTGFMKRNRAGLPKYHKGSKVTFVLTLTKLWPFLLTAVSVDGGKEACLCCGSGMKTNDGYLPAVRLQKPGKVRFLHFCHLGDGHPALRVE
jgi:hypothetical protein